MNRSKLLKEFGFEEEVVETIIRHHDKTGFPAPKKSYHLMWEVYDLSLEETYFWVLDILKGSFPTIEKLEDSFAAAENSAAFGLNQQRLGAQQDKVGSFLATMGQMIKQLLQMVRELRMIDERLTYYDEVDAQCKKEVSQRGRSAAITLKGIFIDLVQGGAKSPASVFGMSQQLEFITLPDLFFDSPPFKTTGELEAHIKRLEQNFNRNVLRVMERHLRQFMEWRKRTHQEHKNRKRFMLQYLLQHFEIIKMYVTWVKPYLRHVSKLTLKAENMKSPDIISAFENSMIDVEVLGSKRAEIKGQGVNGCLLMTFQYRARPEYKVQLEGYQRGPVFIGKVDINYRIYGWTDKELENYKMLKEKETLLLMGEISGSVGKAMNALGKELDKYLEEANAVANKPDESDEEPEEKKSIMEKLLGEFYRKPKNDKGGKAEKEVMLTKREQAELKEKMGPLMANALGTAWVAYHNFKKAHAMVAW